MCEMDWFQLRTSNSDLSTDQSGSKDRLAFGLNETQTQSVNMQNAQVIVFAKKKVCFGRY